MMLQHVPAEQRGLVPVAPRVAFPPGGLVPARETGYPPAEVPEQAARIRRGVLRPLAVRGALVRRSASPVLSARARARRGNGLEAG